MRYAIAFIVALLLCAGIAVFFYEHFIAAMSMVLILSFRRFVFWVLWVLFVIPFMPERWRHVLEHGLLKIRHGIVAVLEWVWLTWKHGRLERRAFMSVCGACACGGFAGVLIFSPGSITRIPLIGQWMSDTVMRISYAHGCVQNGRGKHSGSVETRSGRSTPVHPQAVRKAVVEDGKAWRADTTNARQTQSAQTLICNFESVAPAALFVLEKMPTSVYCIYGPLKSTEAVL